MRLAEAYSRREETLGVIRCDTFAAEIINPVVEFFYYNTVAKCALFQIIEQAIDKSHNLFSPNLYDANLCNRSTGSLEQILPEQEKMLRGTSMRILQCVVKHKLMDIGADPRLAGVTPLKTPYPAKRAGSAPTSLPVPVRL